MLVQRKVSDLSGAEAADEAFVTVIVRRDNRIDTPVALDALSAEIKGLKPAEDLTVIEVKEDSGQSWELVVKTADFNKLATTGSMDDVLKNARSTKGRPKGSRNGSTPQPAAES